ncbi:hypothetical protein DW322_20130 [Rhodococcus rhodnii]|uniref:DUF2079 domain-containing protein n=1 Tax=Rhodococcus rhodnii TaxID=38312 RepID=A0A6P2CM58_9NOCA|nr:hypothetical protein DW322_20130 [Rhodococcus rhodnii]
MALAAAAIVLAATALRVWVAAAGGFYWDDLILTGRSATVPTFSADFLLYDHDGHFMPAAFLLADLATTLAPLQWWLPAVMLVVGQLAASAAVVRLLWVVMGPRPLLLAPLVFYVLCPITLPSFAWWANALNSLPLQFALAWVAADAMKLARTGDRRYAISDVVVTIVALAFFEKSVLVPFVAFATVALAYHVDGVARAFRTALRRCAALWIPTAVVLAVWALVYLTVTDSRVESDHLGNAPGFVHHATSLGLVPTFLGGPWLWDRWPPSPPWATPPTALVIGGWVVLAAAVIGSIVHKRRVAPVWIAAAAYVAASELAMVLTRGSDLAAYELAQTLRYLADSAVVLVVLAALIARAPRRSERPREPRSGGLVALTTVAVVAFAVSSVLSTITFVGRWENNPTNPYLANARVSLAEHRDVPLLDHPVSLWVLVPVATPYNSASHVFGPLPDRPEFADSTPQLRQLDDDGMLVEAVVSDTRTIPQGPVPECGFRVERTPDGVAGDTTIPLDGPLLDWEWTAQLNYFASTAGDVDVRLDTGDTVTVPVEAGLNQVFVRLIGGGDALHVEPTTPGLALCVGSGPVGTVAPTTERVR